ncbi:MAG TPA: ABC transporter permease [Opitutus sp.]|nr:ABC transporter permease [Opitutus sp.]
MPDLRYALRHLLKSSGFTAVAVLSLALALGSATAVFSVVRGVLLRPPPYPDAGRIGVIRTAHAPEITDFNASPGDFLAWRERLPAFAALGAIAPQDVILTGAGQPRRVTAARTTADLFNVFATAPELGRVFGPASDRPGAEPVAVISHDFWQQQFAGAADVIGRTLRLDDRVCTIVGVMPARFLSDEHAAVWLPMAFSAAERSDDYRGARFLEVVGRLRPGVTWARAQSELDAAAAGLARDHPAFNRGWTASVVPLADYRARPVRPALWLLLGAVTCVLAVACSNVAGVKLARGIARERELALRAALGATRRRLIRQLLLESLLLAAAAGIAGWLIATWLLDALLALAPAAVTLAGDTPLDAGLFAFTAALSLGAGLVAGLVPAWRLSGIDLDRALKSHSGSTTAGPAHGRIRRLLVVAQLAVAIALLAGTVLLGRSLVRLTSADPGFNPASALAVQVDLPARRYDTAAQQAAFTRQLLERVRALPGVQSAGVAQALPLRGNWMVDFLIENRPQAGDGSDKTGYFSVSPGYFSAMGIRLLRGRAFADTDTAGAPPVVVVNETFARRYFPGGDALGHRIYLMNGPWRLSEIVGVVADVKQTSLTAPAPPQAYEPFAQWSQPNFTLVVRSAGEAAPALPAALRATVAAVDPEQPVTSLVPLAALVTGAVAVPRFVAALLGAFAFVATAIAMVGILAVMMQAVLHRRREFGLRLALGATPGQLQRRVLRQSFALVAAGCAAGLVLTAAGLPLLRSLFPATRATDPAGLAIVALAAVLTGLLAGWLPARRATRVNPADALRAE